MYIKCERLNTCTFILTQLCPLLSLPLLYTPTSFQVVEADTDELGTSDPTTTLVLVVPAGAMVRVTDAERQPAVTSADDHP